MTAAVAYTDRTGSAAGEALAASVRKQPGSAPAALVVCATPQADGYHGFHTRTAVAGVRPA